MPLPLAPGWKPLPVTLLSGFLGSGKTTLLRHILTSPDPNMRIAAIVNDMAALNIDAALVKKHIVSQANEEDKLIQLQNGCICCTLRGDLLEALVKMARDGQAEYIVIESTGISEPMQVAETFTEEFAEAMRTAVEGEGEDQVEGYQVLKEVQELGGLSKLVSLDTLITMVDAFNFFDNFSTADFITDRWGIEGVAPEDERTVTDLMVDQIEFANCIIINKVDSVGEETKARIHAIVKKLNPQAKVLEAHYAKVDMREVLSTSTFDFEKAATGMGWLQSLHEMSKREVNGKIRFAPKPETEEYGISSFVYTARKPFNPKRLYQLIHDKFVLMEDANEDDEDEDVSGDSGDEDEAMDVDSPEETDFSSSVDSDCWEDESDSTKDETDASEDLSAEIKPQAAVENKRKGIFKGLLRSKGFIWLATRPTIHGAWSQAGAMLTLQGGDRWFCTLDESDWPPGEATRQSILNDFSGRWGDRRQELVMIGEQLDQKKLTTAFDACLLTAPEMRKWEKVMRSKLSAEAIQDKLDDMFEDGFMDWPDPSAALDDHQHSHPHPHPHTARGI